jgi:hypothetical protein
MVRKRLPRRGDLIAVGVLVALAVLAFGLPSILGRPVLPGDDLTQNYPLRVLAGQQIRAGHLPLYNPYIWSGTPLLAGWNAAAAYPLTWLFAVLPGIAAWTVGLVATYAIAALGMYSFLRLGLRLRPTASFAGAVTFAFGGAMAAQVTHFGLVTGMSWVPLGLLAVCRLTEPRATASGGAAPARDSTVSIGSTASMAWTGVLGLAAGLIVLAGEPRAIADGYVIIIVYAAWRLVCAWRLAGTGQVLPALGLVAGGIVLGVALSAAQLLPGMSAISTSQRAGASLALFSSGSLPDRWLALMLVPDLLGGSGTLTQPSFFGFYNLTEIEGYVGILPVVAALAMLARVRLAQVRSWRQLPEWLVWHVMAVVGIALALGGNTPLGSVLARLPFYGTQRLQSRNILILDLALAILLAYWADQPFVRREGNPARFTRRVSPEAVLSALPAVAVIALVVAVLAGPGLVHWLDSNDPISETVIARLRPWLIPYLLLGSGALALVCFGRRLPARLCAGLIAGFVVLDISAFSALAVVQIAPAPASSSSLDAVSSPANAASSPAATSAVLPRLSVRPVSALGYPGRFAIYDPDLLDTSDLSVLEPPDLNSMTGISSVQGYTSIVDGRYAAATGSHLATGDGQDTLSAAAISDGTLDSLDTTIVLTLPQYADGVLKAALRAPHWVPEGFDGSFEVFRNELAKPPLTLKALPGRSAAGASVTAVTGPATNPTQATVQSAEGVRVVRAVSAIPGWSASWRPLTGRGAGRPVTLPVQADGVVQAVDVPAGTGVLTWTYTPPRLAAGLALSLASAVVIVALGLASLVRRLRWRARRHAGAEASEPSGGDEARADALEPARRQQPLPAIDHAFGLLARRSVEGSVCWPDSGPRSVTHSRSDGAIAVLTAGETTSGQGTSGQGTSREQSTGP